MAAIDVKITELQPVSELKNNDLFLIAHPLDGSSGTVQQTPYTSNSIAASVLSGSIKTTLENSSLSVNNKKWEFNPAKNSTGSNNLPRVNAHYDVGSFKSALEKDAQRKSIVFETEGGWYKTRPTTVLQNSSNVLNTALIDTAENNSIANIDVVMRSVAAGYDSLLNRLSGTIDALQGRIATLEQKVGQSGPPLSSYVGMIIYSTTLDTDVKVKAQYGGTSWKRHGAGGYFLACAPTTETVLSNNLRADAGKNTMKLTESNLPQHTHTFTGSSTSVTVTPSGTSSAKYVTGASSTHPADERYDFNAITGLATGHLNFSGVTWKGTVIPKGTISKTGSSSAFDNRPALKWVYVWERIS